MAKTPGLIVNGYNFFPSCKIFSNLYSLRIMIIILILSISISLPNSIRLFMPIEIIQNELFWEKDQSKKRIEYHFAGHEF